MTSYQPTAALAERARRRIYFVMMTDVIGGGEILTLELARAMQQHMPVTIVSSGGSPLLTHAKSLGIQTETLELGSKLSRRTAVRAAASLPFARRRLLGWVSTRLTEHDWCCFQYKWEELLWAGRAVPPKILLLEHGPIPQMTARLRPTRRMLRRAFVEANVIVAWSDPAAASIESVSNRKSTRVDAGVNSRAIARAARDREQRRAELVGKSGRDSLVLLYSGRIASDKGLDQIVDALPFLPSATLVVAGEGPARGEIASRAIELGVENRVRFLGYVDDPLPTVAAADVCLLLSRSPGEGRPLSVVEASALGTPVLGNADSPALQALAAEGRAELVEPTTAQVIARAVSNATGHARVCVPARDWSTVAEEIVGLLDADERARSSISHPW